MKLVLQNIGLISHSEIMLDGITLIVGNNSTGKSTIGRALYLHSASLYGISQYIEDDRQKTILQEMNKRGETLDLILKELSGAKRRRKVSEAEMLRKIASAQLSRCTVEDSRDIEKILHTYLIGHAKLYGVKLSEALEKPKENRYQEWLSVSINRILAILEPGDDLIGKRRVSMKLDRYFSGQIIRVKRRTTSENDVEDSESSYIEVVSDDATSNRISFERNKKAGKDVCSSVLQSFTIEHPAVYIENPRVLDKLPSRLNWNKTDILDELLSPNVDSFSVSQPYNIDSYNNYIINFYINRFITDSLSEKQEPITMDSMASEESATATQQEQYEANLKILESALDKIVCGHLVMQGPKGAQFSQNDLERNIEISSLSTGIKAMSLLRFALEKGCIQKGSVLILDEPEINLHPDWQIEYAKIIVQMQALFDLRIVITTHSPYFMQAIEYSTKIQHTNSKYHCYLAEYASGRSRISCVDDFPSLGYKKLIESFSKLESMKNSIQNEDGVT